MNQFSDQRLAKRMLETREHGFSLGFYFRRGAKRYLLLAGCFAFAMVVFVLLQLWTVFHVLLGMLAGCLLRDIGWVRAVGRTWPFSLKVTDWDKVQRLADEKEVA